MSPSHAPFCRSPKGLSHTVPKCIEEKKKKEEEEKGKPKNRNEGKVSSDINRQSIPEQLALGNLNIFLVKVVQQ